MAGSREMKIFPSSDRKSKSVRIPRKRNPELPMCNPGYLRIRGFVISRWNRDTRSMIRLTRLNNRPLVVNSELIKFIENAPDTVITLVSGEKIVVLETAEEVINRIVDYRRRLRRSPANLTPIRYSAEPSDGSGDPAGREEPSADED